ncbi:MAG TPA: hypothetical protein VGS02_18955 [Acidobacteriaceae bacterium]|nr:hypothetical protein [Acidobacteriaceae bacterium]
MTSTRKAPGCRLWLALVLPGAICSGQALPAPGSDASALVRRAVANHFVQQAAHQPERFDLHRRDERRNVVREIMETPQGDVAMLVAVNGGPLSPAGQQIELDRLHALAANPALQEHRRKNEAADQARIDKLMHILPQAFLYRYDTVVSCVINAQPVVQVPGRALPPPAPPEMSQCYHLTFTPNPKFSPPDVEAKILKGMAGEVWIEKSAERLVRLNAHLIDDVDFGWGIVGRLDKGGTIFLEQAQISPGDWELTRMRLNFSGKALLVKAISVRMTEEMGNYAPVPPGTDYRKAIQMLEDSSQRESGQLKSGQLKSGQ